MIDREGLALITEIAKRLGRNRHTVLAFCQQHGVPMYRFEPDRRLWIDVGQLEAAAKACRIEVQI